MSTVHVNISNDTLEFENSAGSKRAIPRNVGKIRFQVHGWNSSPSISRLTFREFRIASLQPNGSFAKGALVGAKPAYVVVAGAAPSPWINWPAPTFPRLVAFEVQMEFVDGYVLTIDPVIDDRP